MSPQKRIDILLALEAHLKNLSSHQLKKWKSEATAVNPWFNAENIDTAMKGIFRMLNPSELKKVNTQYSFEYYSDRKIGIIMAGNIPFVGLHDLLCGILSGHNLFIKLSTLDSPLMKNIITILEILEPELKEKIHITDNLKDMDGIIATGSSNTFRYFEYYFQNIPHLLRKNRASIAIIKGDETEEDLKNLGKDVFTYFSLGCRNISKLYVPNDYELQNILTAFQPYAHVGNHHRYRNNYDYNKSIFLINKISHLDTGFLLIDYNKELHSPLSVLHVETYHSLGEVRAFINNHSEDIQCVVGSDYIPFGQAQLPGFFDFADNQDTLHFLNKFDFK